MIHDNLSVLDERLELLACAIRAARRFIADVRGAERVAQTGALDLAQGGLDAAMAAVHDHSNALTGAYNAVMEVFDANESIASASGAELSV